jgi:hypothetical protein
MSVTDDNDPESQAEKRRVLINDARVREQSRNGDTSSYIDHYSPEMGGRFSHQGAATVIGQSPVPAYPSASSPWCGPDLVGDEPPLGFDVNALEPAAGPPASPAAGPGEPAPDAPSAPVASLTETDVELGVGSPPPSSKEE